MNQNKFQLVRAALVAAALVVSCAACTTGSLSDAEYVAQAEDHLDDGEVKAATILLKNALQQNPDNARARWLLGKLHLDFGDPIAAEKEMKRAAELGVAEAAVKPYLARAWLAQRKFDDLEQLQVSSSLNDDEAVATVLAAQGLGRLARGKVTEAFSRIERALQTAPDSSYAQVAMARVLMEQGKLPEARTRLTQVTERAPQFPDAWSALGDLERIEKNLEAAESAFTKAAEARANGFTDYLKRARVRIERANFDGAREDIKMLKAQAPEHPDVYYLEGLLAFNDKQYSNAKSAFERALRAEPRHVDAKFYLALVNFMQGHLQQAERYGREVYSAVPGFIPVRKLLATIALRSGRIREAQELVRPIVQAREDDVAATVLLASALHAEGRTSEAEKLFAKAIEHQPNEARLRVQRAVTLLSLGREADGIAEMKQAYAIDPGFELADVALVSHYAGAGRLEEALAAAHGFRERRPESPTPYVLIGKVHALAERPAAAAEAFEKALRIAPSDPAANHGLAQLAMDKQDFVRARALYETVLRKHPDDLPTLTQLAALELATNNDAEAEAFLNRAMAAHPRALEPKLLLGYQYLKRGEPARVEPILFSVSEQQRTNADVIQLAGHTALAQKEYGDARRSFARLVEQRSDSPRARIWFAQALVGAGERDRAEQQLRKALELDPDNFVARLALARIALATGRRSDAKGHLNQLEKIAAEHPDVVRLKAQFAQAQGDMKSATELYENVFASVPNTVDMLSLARSKWFAGNPQDAVLLQEEWLKQHPDDSLAALTLASAYSERNQSQSAVQQYESILRKDGNNVGALNNLAWELKDSNPARALEYANRAYQLKPDSFAVLDTLAVVSMKNGHMDRAIRYIERALAQHPQHPSLRYHSAMIRAAAGERTKAARELQALLLEEKDFPQRRDAKQLLSELQSQLTR